MGIFSGFGGPDTSFAKDTVKQQQGLQGQAWNQTQDYLGQLRQAFSPYLNGNVGFDPKQLALMRSAFLNKAASGYQNAGANVRAALARTGSTGNGPVGGDYVRGIAGLEGAQADTISGGLANIDLANLQQMLQNKFNAGSVLQGGVAANSEWGRNFTSGMNEAMNAYSRLAATPGMLGQAFGGALGGSLGKAAAAGLGKLHVPGQK